MAKFVVAGRADCPSYARAEILADTLAARLPDFCVHKVSIYPRLACSACTHGSSIVIMLKIHHVVFTDNAEE